MSDATGACLDETLPNLAESAEFVTTSQFSYFPCILTPNTDGNNGNRGFLGPAEGLRQPCTAMRSAKPNGVRPNGARCEARNAFRDVSVQHLQEHRCRPCGTEALGQRT